MYPRERLHEAFAVWWDVTMLPYLRWRVQIRRTGVGEWTFWLLGSFRGIPARQLAGGHAATQPEALLAAEELLAQLAR